MSRLSKESTFCSVASTSQEGLEEEAPTSASNRTLKVTLLSSEWKSSKGGLSTINRELAIQLAKHPNVEVSVYLPQCSEEDKKVAGSHNVKLIEAEELPGLEPVLWLASVPENHAMDCIIGHGVPLGRQIPLIKRHNHHCKWIQVVHTAPEELGMYKTYADAISKGEKKHQAEVKLCEWADQVVAVGPKLADAYSRSLRPCQKDQEVLTLTPGIFTEFSEVKQATEEGNNFVVLVFGRGDSEDFELKGYDIAAKAIAELKDMSCHLMFVGAPSGKEEEVTEKLLDYGISPAQLTVRCFDESREGLAKLLCEVDLAIMPSRTEGFGLTALEALSAGLPVLVSGNSGLGEAFKKVATGSNWIVASEEPKDWAKAISAVREKDRDIRLEECEILREKYGAKHSWQKQCYSLVETMQKISFASLGLRVERESVKLKGPSSQSGALDSANSARPKEGTKETVTTAVTNDVAETGVYIPTSDEIFRLIVTRRFLMVPPSSVEEFNDFKEYISTMKGLVIQDVKMGSLLITVKCRSLQVLEDLWTDYTSGHLNEMVQKCLVTEDILNDLGLSELKLSTTIRENDYKAYKQILQNSDDPGRQRNDGEPSWYDKAVNVDYQEEVMQIPKDKVGLIIGRKGWRIKDIFERSGVKELRIKDDQVHLRGTEEQCANAKKIIDMISKGEDSPDQGSWKKLDFIPKEYMGQVIGKNRKRLDDIEEKTKATLRVFKRNLYIKGSTESQRRAIREIKEIVASARLKTDIICCYIDDSNLPEGCELKLVPVEEQERMVLPGSHSQYRLRPSEEYEPVAETRSDIPSYQANLVEHALTCLRKIKHEIESKKFQEADMWCHFGTAIIREPDEADVAEIWNITEVVDKLQNSASGKKSDWRVAFKEGVQIDRKVLQETFSTQPTEDDLYAARYDLSFLTPRGRSIRCKVWVANKGVQSKLEELPIPFSDVRNIVEELYLEDELTRSRCRAWLVLSSHKYLQADIIFPGCIVDCRVMIRPLSTYATQISKYEQEQTKVLAGYLSKLKFTEANGIHLPHETLPEGFLFNYKRRSHRTMYVPRDGFTLIVSEESTWCRDDRGEQNRETTDLHLGCVEWDRVLSGEDWEPEMIVSKLPEFLQFVHQVQDFLSLNNCSV